MILFFENRQGNTRRGRQAKYGIDTNVECPTLIEECRNGKYSGDRLKYTPPARRRQAAPARRGGLREIGWRQMRGTSYLPAAGRRSTELIPMSNSKR